MAITTKRPVARVNVGEANLSKYLNQMMFKGIVLNNNPYDVDQLSLKDARNVYVDDNGTLISRPPIVVEPLPAAYIITNDISTPTSILQAGYTLYDIFETGKVKIYVCLGVDEYDIVAVSKTTLELTRFSNVAAYHLSAFEQYVILFNNIGAVVLDVNNFNLGWRPISDVAEIPITKRVVGQESFTYPGNQFTEDYKEQYVMSDDVISMIPEGTAEVEVTQSPSNKTWTLENANINSEFRILRSLGISVQSFDIVTTTNSTTGINVLAIARFDHVMLSFDYGLTFEKVLYPSHGDFAQVASISKDGLYFFFVARDGVYRYSIDDKEWVVIRLITLTPEQLTLEGTGINNACCFLSAEVFTFSLCYYEDGLSTVDVYWKGPKILNDDFAENTLGRTSFNDLIYPELKLTKAAKDCVTMSIAVREVSAVQVTELIAWLPAISVEDSTFIQIHGRSDGTELVNKVTVLNKRYGSIETFEATDTHPIDDSIPFLGVRVIADTLDDDNTWYKSEVIVGVEDTPPESYLTFEYLEPIAEADDNGAPISLVTGYLIDKMTHSVDGSAALPIEVVDAIRTMTIAIDKYFYIMFDDVLYTNKLTTSNTASLTFTRLTNIPYTDIPTLSYTGAQLFLGFGNILMITDNRRDGNELFLNLPAINNHSFMSNLNGLLNVSTTEVAAFLVDKVYIITKVADDLLGYRYDYLSTRLSVGIRQDDSVINTLDGKITMYPTVQGLAMMNYQPNVASTDQIVEYATNNIRTMWNEFYAAGAIKIIQMKDYIYFSNGTTTYLMLDLRGLTWWLLTSPFAITRITTDQLNFNIISNGLYKYKPDYLVYKDVLTRDIDWMVESQPNHFDAPVYYKNLKQLIFQLEEVDDVERTITVQIKLYRKSFVSKEPEIVGFKIEGYRTFVKRFNYWKINEMQWVLSADPASNTPAQLKLNGLSIKYEISEEVRS